MTYKITITPTEKEQERIDFLLEDTGIRTAEDLFVFLMNKEYKRSNQNNTFPFSPANIMKSMSRVVPPEFLQPEEK